MRRFRSKLVLLLIVYFAGFATAIYMLTPAPDNDTLSTETQKSWSFSALKSNEFALSCNESLHKCVDFFKDVSCKAGEFIKEKINERKAES